MKKCKKDHLTRLSKINKLGHYSNLKDTYDKVSYRVANMEEIGSKWANRFIIAAILQGGVITAMSIAIVGIQMSYTQVNIIQYLSLSFDGTAKWFFLGIIFYLIVVLAVAVSALFYSHLEITLKKKFSKASNVLAAIHLIGMNIGGAGAMIIMAFAGLAGTGILTVFTEGKIGPKYPAIMDSFIEPIGGFIAILALGVICGGMGFILAFRSK